MSIKFENGNAMYEYVHAGNDLYSKSLGVYLFDYNDAGALCCYTLQPEEFAEAARLCKESGEYWGAFLGWKGSAILDESEYDDDEHRYSDNWEMRKMYLKPSLDFCDETYMAEDWMNTGEVTEEYILEEDA